MATDFEAEGLLEGLEGDARDARRRLLEELEAGGTPLDELREAVAEGRLALLPLEQALEQPGPRYRFAEVAERSGLEPGFLTALIRALGLPLPQDGNEAVFTDADVDAARTVAGFRAAGIDDEALLETSRVLGHSMSQVVAAARSLLGRTFFKAGDSEYDVASRWGAAARNLNPEFDKVMSYVLRAQQIAQLRGDVFNMAGLGSDATKVSVAFADLAGFTRLGEQVAPGELGGIAGRLTALATDAASPPVRLVKMIGDAAMLVSPEPRPLLEAVLDVVEAVDAEGEDFPPARAGIAYGEALGRAGDWFGRPVNLASRITDKARPGSVVVTGDFKDLVGEEGFNWSKLPGKRRFKGISGEVDVYRVRRNGLEPAE
ncbi:MAG: adenylate cyclase regulatory domain-containing protein [Thermoleophilaceae bacterium]